MAPFLIHKRNVLILLEENGLFGIWDAIEPHRQQVTYFSSYDSVRIRTPPGGGGPGLLQCVFQNGGREALYVSFSHIQYVSLAGLRYSTLALFDVLRFSGFVDEEFW